MGVYDDIHPPEVVNETALFIFLFVAGSSIAGLLLDCCVFRKVLKGVPEDRPRGWVLGMLSSSYMLLLPGLLHTLFGYRISVMGGTKVVSERKENTLEFAHELVTSGSQAGCFFVVFFAMVLPVVKLILLMAGGLLRHSRDLDKKIWARRFVQFVQKISKWASPDMFAYILLTYLIRGLNHPPILLGQMDLDVGFTCFATFCIASTISSLGVRAPSLRDIGAGEFPSRYSLKPSTALGLTVVAGCVFCVMFVLGLRTPCMALRLDMDALFNSGKVDITLKPLVEALHVSDLAADDVTLWNCTKDLLEWSTPETGPMEANSFVAFFLLSVLVISFTVLDMIVLSTTAFYTNKYKQKPPYLPKLYMFFRKLSMLDVCITGIFIIVTAGRIYRESGVVVTLREGWTYLLVAELCHYVAHYAVVATQDDSLSSPSFAFQTDEASEGDTSTESGEE